ncbi:uncharacterized protein PITG_01519 [Phytophthora infestans T30-4]|uniref:SET domain-containing protein n=1 Tax=Phytophthora infestans (strain T30-4) TaxID=403677 RepID=D0MTG1_PHYIT|nr:uncharacterized protein PITG_01519 [Phytophthora infestans T30-4]EEY61258.1 hypothetical protein PITG_01519 [Phytophthora infestans T30-4]|eukprot:XP_002908175.1 hypothetical protein PITG_01519 [Phytophthora infestans T30-4]
MKQTTLYQFFTPVDRQYTSQQTTWSSGQRRAYTYVSENTGDLQYSEWTAKRCLGAFAEEPITRGVVVREYVGEIIDDNERQIRELHVPSEYTMAYGSGSYIDATRFGNESRFFNHSCDPNYASEEWSVNGVYRIGVVARSDIKAGDELTIDYGSGFRLSKLQVLQLLQETIREHVKSQFKVPARCGIVRGLLEYPRDHLWRAATSSSVKKISCPGTEYMPVKPSTDNNVTSPDNHYQCVVITRIGPMSR